MSEDQNRPVETAGEEIDRRVREIEDQAARAQLPARRGALLPEPEPRRSPDRKTGDESVGGLLQLLAGVGMIAVGLFLYASRLFVWSGFRTSGGSISIGLVFIPFILGVALVVLGGRLTRTLGIALAALAVVALLVGSLDNLRLFLRPTSLFDFLLILSLVGGGLGLLVRGARRS